MAAENDIKLEYERHTDVMHVDISEPRAGSVIDALEVGDQLGFPGQIVLRVERDTQTPVGISICRFRSFKRKLLWNYRIASFDKAIRLFVDFLRTGRYAGKLAHA